MELVLSRNLERQIRGRSFVMTRRRKKVLHLITSLELGGAQSGLLLGLPRFENDEYEHILCSITDRMNMAEDFEKVGVKTMSLQLQNKTDFMVVWRLRKLLKEVKPDVLHTYLLHGNLLGRVVGSLTGVPVIISSERTIGQARRWGRILTQLTNPLAQAVEVNSSAGKLSVIKDLGVPESKVRIIRSGFDLNSITSQNVETNISNELGLNEDTRVILMAGRLRPVKGIDYGIRAFTKLVEDVPNAHLIIAGDGEERENLEGLARSLSVHEKTTFLGVRSDLPGLLRESDAFLLPSLNEGFPRVAVEALAIGCPVVATNVGGTPEIVIDGHTGILVESKNSGQMADALKRVIEDSELSSKLVTQGRENTVKYGIDSYVRSLDTLYTELTAR